MCFLVSFLILFVIFSSGFLLHIVPFIFGSIFLIAGTIRISSLLLFHKDTYKVRDVVLALIVAPIGFIGLWFSCRDFLGFTIGLSFVIATVTSLMLKYKEIIAGMLDAVLVVLKIVIGVVKIALIVIPIVLVGLVICLYIDVYDPLSNNEWKSVSFFSYPEWFVTLSDTEQEALMRRGKNSVISSVPLPLRLVKFEIREIVEMSEVAWTYKKNDKGIFYIIWYDGGYHFTKVSRYCLDNSKELKRGSTENSRR